MLTSEEKEMLNTIREQMDDEQRKAFDAMSDAEKKAVLEEVKNQWNNLPEDEKRAAMQGGHASWENTKGQIRRLQDMPFGEFMMEYGGKGILSAPFIWLFLKMTRTKAGCGCLIVLVILAVILLAAMVNT